MFECFQKKETSGEGLELEVEPSAPTTPGQAATMGQQCTLRAADTSWYVAWAVLQVGLGSSFMRRLSSLLSHRPDHPRSLFSPTASTSEEEQYLAGMD